MLKAFLIIDEEIPLSDVTGITWLDAALVLAAYLLAEEENIQGEKQWKETTESLENLKLYRISYN